MKPTTFYEAIEPYRLWYSRRMDGVLLLLTRVLLWLQRRADDRSHTLITVALLAVLIVLVFACAAVVP